MLEQQTLPHTFANRYAQLTHIPFMLVQHLSILCCFQHYVLSFNMVMMIMKMMIMMIMMMMTHRHTDTQTRKHTDTQTDMHTDTQDTTATTTHDQSGSVLLTHDQS